MKTNCEHPNCKLDATKPHPRNKEGEVKVCQSHYTEIDEVVKRQKRYDYSGYNQQNNEGNC